MGLIVSLSSFKEKLITLGAAVQHLAEGSSAHFDLKRLASSIDHTNLRPEAKESQITTLCSEALTFGFKGVCVNSCWVPHVTNLLRGSATLCVSVIGFPLGANHMTIKAHEAEWCVRAGAAEIDMVINIGLLKAGSFERVKQDIQGVARACGEAKLKVIIETGLLTNEEKVTACKLSAEVGAHFVKTCTGFSGGAATVEDVLLMKDAVNNKLEVKASGGIKSFDFAVALLTA